MATYQGKSVTLNSPSPIKKGEPGYPGMDKNSPGYSCRW